MLAIKKRGTLCSGLVLGLACLCLTGCQPPGPRALLKGDKLIRDGRYAEAVEKLETATRLLPRTALAWNHLGLAYHGNRQPEGAQRAYQKALSLDYKLAAAHYNLGCLYLEQGNPAAAVNELTTYTLLESGSLDGWLKLATAHLRTHKLEAAERCFKTALELHPRHPEAVNGLGVIQYQRRRTQDALDFFNGALAQNPDYGPALYNAAVVAHQTLNSRADALRKYNQYLALQPRPTNWEAVENAARLLKAELSPPRPPLSNLTSQYVTIAAVPLAPTNLSLRSVTNRSTHSGLAAAARTNAMAATATNPVKTVPISITSSPALAMARPVETPKAANAATNKAIEVELTRLPDEPVIKPAQDIVKTTAPTPDPLATSAAPMTAAKDSSKPPKKNLLERLNPFAGRPKTVTNSTTATSPPEITDTSSNPSPPPETSPPLVISLPRYAYISPTRPAAGNRAPAERAFAQGLKAQRSGKNSEALAQYQAATQADPAYYEAYFNQGLAAYELGQWFQSLAAYEYALVIKPDSADARYNFALALKRANYPQDAANELTKLLQANPDETRAHLPLANLYAQQLHQPTLAREHYLKLLERDPRHPDAGQIRYWLATHP
jgi:tetratricopeptide (TPR) repeat protein